MGLITRPATEPLVRGNRANALASTGPRTAQGKRRSSRNALKHGIYSHDLHQAMLDLGEDPRDYRRLLKGLTDSHQPANESQRLIVEDIAWLRWQKRRIQRGQAGIMAQARERAINQRLKRQQELNREITCASQKEVSEHGLMPTPDSPSKFERVLSLLNLLIDQVRANKFALNAEPILTMLWGEKRATLRATNLTNLFRRLRRLSEGFVKCAVEPAAPPDAAAVADDPDSASDDSDSADYDLPFEDPKLEIERIQALSELLDEKQLVTFAYQWYVKEHVEVTPALLNACFAPSDEGGRTWREIRLRERTFDREIEFKTRLLMDMQSAGAAPRSPAPLTERTAGNPRRRDKDRKGRQPKGKKPAQGSGGRSAVDCALRDRRAGAEAQAPEAWEPREVLPPEDAGAEKVKNSPNEAVRSLKIKDPAPKKSVKNAPNGASKGPVCAVTEADSGVFRHSGGDVGGSL